MTKLSTAEGARMVALIHVPDVLLHLCHFTIFALCLNMLPFELAQVSILLHVGHAIVLHAQHAIQAKGSHTGFIQAMFLDIYCDSVATYALVFWEHPFKYLLPATFMNMLYSSEELSRYNWCIMLQPTA